MSFYVPFIKAVLIAHNSWKYYKKIVKSYKGVLILKILNILFRNIKRGVIDIWMEVQNDRDYKRKRWDRNSEK